MEKRDFQTVVDAALRRMEDEGASENQLRLYRQTGFGAIRRHFLAIQQSDFSAEAVDSVVLQMRNNWKNGNVSDWKWRLVRRGGELLKHFVRTGEIEMSALRPWNPILQKTNQSVELDNPTSEQLADPDDLFALIWRVRQQLFKKGLTESAVHHYTAEGFSVILRRHIHCGLECYSESLASEMVSQKRGQYEKGETSRGSYQNLRKANCLLSEMHQAGEITLSPLPAWGQREPISEYAEALRLFCDNASRTGLLASGTIKTARSAIRGLLFELEDHGVMSLRDAILPEISRAITQMSKRYKGGLHSALFSVRTFLRYLHEIGLTPNDLSLAIPEMAAHRTTFREGFTADEIQRLLATPNPDTRIGKRDYAMLLLAAQTGLRACDVVKLKREEIDWRTNEIRIVQQKTGKPLALPLEPESGNAIADYLLHARPKSDLPYVFLCHSGERRSINNRSASGIATKHLRRARIVLPGF